MPDSGSIFRESFVEADGFTIRAMTAGEGPPLVHLHGASGLWLTPAHEQLARQFRVIAFEMPGFGAEENARSRTQADLAATMGLAVSALGIDRFHLMGSSFGSAAALWLAIQQPNRVSALVLEAPSALRDTPGIPVTGPASEVARRVYAHPERSPPPPSLDAERATRLLVLTTRLRAPPPDMALREAMRGLTVPLLAVFGTRDTVTPPELGRLYKDLLPAAHVAFIYDAGHAVTAERPEAFVEIVSDFLERGDAFLISQTRTSVFP